MVSLCLKDNASVTDNLVNGNNFTADTGTIKSVKIIQVMFLLHGNALDNIITLQSQLLQMGIQV